MPMFKLAYQHCNISYPALHIQNLSTFASGKIDFMQSITLQILIF